MPSQHTDCSYVTLSADVQRARHRRVLTHERGWLRPELWSLGLPLVRPKPYWCWRHVACDGLLALVAIVQPDVPLHVALAVPLSDLALRRCFTVRGLALHGQGWQRNLTDALLALVPFVLSLLALVLSLFPLFLALLPVLLPFFAFLLSRLPVLLASFAKLFAGLAFFLAGLATLLSRESEILPRLARSGRNAAQSGEPNLLPCKPVVLPGVAILLSGVAVLLARESLVFACVPILLAPLPGWTVSERRRQRRRQRQHLSCRPRVETCRGGRQWLDGYSELEEVDSGLDRGWLLLSYPLGSFLLLFHPFVFFPFMLVSSFSITSPPNQPPSSPNLQALCSLEANYPIAPLCCARCLSQKKSRRQHHKSFQS